MTLSGILPLIVFLLVLVIVAFYIRKNTPRRNFETEYFVAGRRLGPFVLVMTTIATFGSITSFIGLPGQAWEYGFGWVYMCTAQVVSLLLLFGIMGKKLALIGRRIGAFSTMDIISARYKSNALTLFLSIALVLFFTALIIVQFVGAAKIFEAATGYSYHIGLVVIALTTALYTTIGGFRGVAITDTICGIVMIASALILGMAIVAIGGGYSTIMEDLQTLHPVMFDITAGGELNVGLFVTQWLVLGMLVFAMPHTSVRCLSFKDTRSLRWAMVIGTIIAGLLLVGLTVLGALSYGVFPDTLSEYGADIDDVIPLVITQALPPWLTGLVVVGPIAAAVSTVSSLLICSSVTIIKGIFRNPAIRRHRPLHEGRVHFGSQVASILLSFIALVVAIAPPTLIWRLSISIFGCIEVTFCWLFLFGLFWRRSNKVGATMAVVSGLVVFFATSPLDSTIFGEFGEIIFALITSLFFMIFGSLLFRTKEDPHMVEVFFPEDAPSTKAAVFEYDRDEEGETISP